MHHFIKWPESCVWGPKKHISGHLVKNDVKNQQTSNQNIYIYICICMCVCMCVFSRHMTPSNLSPVPTRCKAAPDHSWDILGWPTWIPPEASWWEGWGRSRNQKRSSSHHYTTLLKFAGLFFLDFTGGFHLNANVSSCPVRDHLHEEHWGFRRLQSR